MKLTSFVYRIVFLLFLWIGAAGGSPALAADMSAPPVPPTGAQALPQYAQPQYFYATVEKIEGIEQPTIAKTGGNETSEIVTLKLTSGPNSGKEVISLHQKVNISGVVNMNLNVGDQVIVAETQAGGKAKYDVADYQRLPYVYILLGVFALVMLAIGRKVGIKSLFVICFAVAVILEVMIPQIIKGQWSITMITLVVSALITLVTQITVSGFKAKTWGAILGTVGGVAMASLLASLSIFWMHLTGLETEEAVMLKVTYLHSLNFQEVLFAGIILGALGAVMDVAISIASSLQEIKLSNPRASGWNLFTSGMNIGKDIMGTMSNTLILAYLGSFLPLILLIAVQKDLPLIQMMNLGLIITEVVRALTGSIGLICTIPITAAVTAFFLTMRDSSKKKPLPAVDPEK